MPVTGGGQTASAPAGTDAPPSSADAGGSASGASSFMFGGGCALLVALLTCAGPSLRRRVSMLPAARPPAAFQLGLERPG